MHETMCRRQSGSLLYYTCEKLGSVRHAFTTRHGGVSRGDCAGLNLGVRLDDTRENVMQNFGIITKELGMPAENLTFTKQVHRDEVSVVTQEHVGVGAHQPFIWESDAIITALPGVPLAGFYADCVVTLLYDPATHTAGVCHAGWRGTAAGILAKTADKMADALGSRREEMLAVIGPSIGMCCFETDADVPEAMEKQLGREIQQFVHAKGEKFFVDLQGINKKALLESGLKEDNIIDSGLCTYCHSDEFWSHRVTNGRRGVQAGLICL